MQRKPEQSICTVSPLLQTTLKRMALVACTVPHGRPWLMPWARLAADSVHGLACRPSVAYCSRRRCRNACLGAAGSLANGRVSADACVGLPELGSLVATPCAFSPLQRLAPDFPMAVEAQRLPEPQPDPLG
ncbi:hypothetical protein XcvCFBP7112P_16005 [Xanthomonas citri pv. vignicola]|nr:hypothetical protein XcvCFBP7112P_16005 [Xanthomonas citri pv. vignicola]